MEKIELTSPSVHYCLTLTRLDQIRLLDLQPQPAVAFLAGTCPTFGQDVIWNHPYSSCMTLKKIKSYFLIYNFHF